VLLLGYQDNANYPVPYVGYGGRKWDKGGKELRVKRDRGREE
jgi:hypothetical protein